MKKRTFLVLVLLLTGVTTIRLAHAGDSACGNGNPGGPGNRPAPSPSPSSTPDTNPPTPNPSGGDPVIPYTGNEYRDIDDLKIWGGVGHHQLLWSRHASSRAVANADLFGQGHYWRHNYQWDLTSAGVDSQGRQMMTVAEPTGSVWNFTQTSPTQWSGTTSCSSKLIPQGTGFIYQTSGGYSYYFTSMGAGAYQMSHFTDDIGNNYTLTYNSANQVTSVSEPGGRSLQIAYTTISDTNYGALVNLAALNKVPTAGQWITLPVTNTNAYRYVRVLAADGSYGNFAEVQFFDTKGNQLTGALLSSDPSQAPNAFDSNTNTSFVSASGSGSYVGLDLGVATRIGSVKVLPTPGHEAAMYPQQSFSLTPLTLQGLNSAPTSLTVIDHVTTSDGRSVQYQYTPFNDPVLAMSFPTLTGVLYGDGTSASYAYTQIFGGSRPLVSQYNDVRCDTRQQYSQTVYQTQNAAVLGMVDHQVNPATGGTILTLGNNQGNTHAPTIVFANGCTNIESFPSGLMTARGDGTGRYITYQYDTNGFINFQKDTYGSNWTGFVRNEFGGILTQTNADNSTESWTRNSLNAVTSYTDTLGNTTTWTRDASNRVTGISYPDGSHEAFTYNGFGEVLTHTLANGGTESFAYGPTGLLLSKTDTLGNVTSYGYDSAGRLNSATDARGNTTRMTYNERGLVAQITNPDGSSRSASYDARGNLTAESNELGNTWSYTYDPTFSLLLSKTDPLGRTTSYAYTPNCPEAKPILVTSPSGKQISNSYDLAWHLLSSTVGAGSPDAATTKYSYDQDYNVKIVTDGRGYFWWYTYDNRNRRLSFCDPQGNRTWFSYDSDNNLLSKILPDGTMTTNTYDSMHRLLTSTDPQGHITARAYDASGNLISLTDAKGNVYSYSYDLRNRCLATAYPDGTSELWSYDSVGNVSTYTTRVGQVATCSYDNRNRNISYSWSDSTPAVAETYDVAGRLLSLSNSASVDSYQYDSANQLTSETQAITGQLAHAVGYSYDADGNRSTLTYPEGTQLSYGYNGRNLLASIVSGGSSNVATFSYDGNGNRVTKILGNGVTTRYAYNTASQLGSVTNALAGGGSAVANYIYTLNQLGNYTIRREITSLASKADFYYYDSIAQATNIAYSGGKKVGYAYDATGNRTSVTTTLGTNSSVVIPYLANACNEYTQVGSLLVGYDKNGNLTSDQNGNTYVYDAQNRLVQATTKAGVIETIAYDAQNRIVSRSLNGLTSITYAYDGWNLLSEYDTYGVIDAYYVQGPGNDELLARNPTIGAVSYYIQDGNNNVTTLIDGSGNVQERYTYDIYGAPSITDGAGHALAASAVGNRFLFTGREYIAELGLYDYRNRVYSPSLGRFLQTDPIRFNAGDINIYRYCGNNPLTGTDPNGLCEPAPVVTPWGEPNPDDEMRILGQNAVAGALGVPPPPPFPSPSAPPAAGPSPAPKK